MSSTPDLGPVPRRVAADAEQVRRLIGERFPQWARPGAGYRFPWSICGRQAFRDRLSVDEATWARGRGWALWKALVICAQTAGRTDQEAANARRVLDEVFSEYPAG